MTGGGGGGGVEVATTVAVIWFDAGPVPQLLIALARMEWVPVGAFDQV
jgi:hypothetical protein